MKRFVSLVALFALMQLVANIAVAEEFVIRNGIEFGMTVDEVSKIEKANGNELFEGLDSEYWYILENTLAGVPGNSYVQYYFDSEQGLSVCLYDIDPSNYTIETVESLCDAYIKKYGSPIAKGSQLIDTMGAAQTAMDLFIKDMNDYVSKVDYSINNTLQWFYWLQDGSMVEIMLLDAEYSYTSAFSGSYFEENAIYITYTYRTLNEVQELNEHIQQLNDARDTDI